jgi:hypothetical protein
MFGNTKAAMKKKIEVTVGSLANALDRFEQAWQRVVGGGSSSGEVRLTVENLPVLLEKRRARRLSTSSRGCATFRMKDVEP